MNTAATTPAQPLVKALVSGLFSTTAISYNFYILGYLFLIKHFVCFLFFMPKNTKITYETACQNIKYPPLLLFHLLNMAQYQHL